MEMQKRSNEAGYLSLQEELQMSGDFNSMPHHVDLDNEDNNKPRRPRTNGGKKTPTTDFSEAETSSSGFAEETSNKFTQTDGRPGSLLCSIADGDNCQFSIYDDNSTFESRFSKTPQYRQLFSEIFGVLKRAAEAKEGGEDLPLLDGTTTNVPSDKRLSRLLQEDAPSESNDDTQSVVSSVISSVVSEPVYRIHSPVFEASTSMSCEVKQLPPRRTPLEYLNVQVRRKNTTGKKNNRKHVVTTTPDVIPTTNPRYMQSRTNSGKKKFRPIGMSFDNNHHQDSVTWNGNSISIYPSTKRITTSPGLRKSGVVRNVAETHPEFKEQQHLHHQDYKPSSASAEVARLRQLEMSYAEALRMPNKSKVQNHHQRRHY